MRSLAVNRSNSRKRDGAVLATVVAALLAWAAPTSAQLKTTCVSTQIPLGYPDLGEITTPDGNVHYDGVSGQDIFLSNDPLATGFHTWEADFNGDAGGNGVGRGTWKLIVGTWTGIEAWLADPYNNPPPVFTATGGIWEGTFEARGNLFGPLEIQAVGRGNGGAVQGLLMCKRGERSAVTFPVFVYSGWILNPPNHEASR